LALHENSGGFPKFRRNPKILALHENSGGFPKFWRNLIILAEKLSGIVKFMRHIIYTGTKADVEISALTKISALIKKLGAHQKVRRISCAPAYYLGSAESPTADFLQVWLKSSCSSDVASRACRPQVI
jgi:hypothetical protein